MKSIQASIRFSAFIILGVIAPSVMGEDGWQAKVRPLSDQLKGYGLPDFIVEVTFPTNGFLIEEVRDVSHYKLTSLTDPARTLVIKAAKPKGGIGGAGPIATHARQVELVPATGLDPSTEYALEVVFDKTSSGPLQVSAASAPAEEKKSDSEIQRIIDLVKKTGRTDFGLTLDARTPFDREKGLVLDYSAHFNLTHNWTPGKDPDKFPEGWMQKLALTSEGTVKVLNSDTNIADHLQFSGNYEVMWLHLLRDPLTRSDGTDQQGKLMYFYGLRMEAFEFESDQKFQVINYTAKPQFAAWVPYSNIPALWWSRQIGISGNAATPAFVFFGYTYVRPISKDASVVASNVQESDRLEGELAYAFPLTSNLRVGFRGRFFKLLDLDRTPSYQEVFAQYYLNETKTMSVLFKYTHGELPPKFEKGSASSAGFSMQF